MNQLIDTGLTKCGFLFETQGGQGKPLLSLVALNDHSLTFCSTDGLPADSILLTQSTRVFIVGDQEDCLLRVETGVRLKILRAQSESDANDWLASIRQNVGRLSSPALPRSQIQLQRKGRSKTCYAMLHREVLSLHPSHSNTMKILSIHQLTHDSSVVMTNSTSIELKNRFEKVTFSLGSDMELRHWMYALELAINLPKKTVPSNWAAAPPTTVPILCGHLLFLSGKKWQPVYAVLTKDGLFLQHKKKGGGFSQPIKKFTLQPGSMLFSTVLKRHSFELVTFSNTLQLGAPSDTMKEQWLSSLSDLISSSSFDASDPLQGAALESTRFFKTFETVIKEDSVGLILERAGNFAVATVISDFLQRKGLRCGSILSHVEYEKTNEFGQRQLVTSLPVITGFDSFARLVPVLSYPVKLRFVLSPLKVGWLLNPSRAFGRLRFMLAQGNKRPFLEKVYVQLSNGNLSVSSLKRDGNSCKIVLDLHAASIRLVDSISRCIHNSFEISSGVNAVTLKAQSYEEVQEWTSSIALAISMANGDGLLAEVEKRKARSLRTKEADELGPWFGANSLSSRAGQVTEDNNHA
mmetsp:Transcript_27062/g.64229  ORF Transcript_27062/g.64229 Transcript_27062/m.64229 type:complete len:579 (+) Transcript_27062:128-1864(+)